jgi:hypothetical protein
MHQMPPRLIPPGEPIPLTETVRTMLAGEKLVVTGRLRVMSPDPVGNLVLEANAAEYHQPLKGGEQEFPLPVTGRPGGYQLRLLVQNLGPRDLFVTDWSISTGGN